MNASHQMHWETVYRGKSETQTSWFRAHLEESLRLIDALALSPDAPVLDVGGGRATLVDDLLMRGFQDIAVIDLSETALAEARLRLGAQSENVRWIVGDVTETELTAAGYALWHDRAVFHFMTEAADRTRYVAAVARAVRPGGHAVIATFAMDGPERCSDLPVNRYDAAALAAVFAPHFEKIADSRNVHMTPAGREQPFTYVVLRRRHELAIT
ncbi:class I SAM-dependent methyltransferase [Dokdonella soli]|uniref:Class I SAM-dependent methyltransferase n=1 Tax=Dokdonella soli TaxID=529810 RepID=A0ABN1IH76_9GAMM